MRPRLGVTVSRRSGWRIFPLVALNVWLAGGRAVRWDTKRDVDLDDVDGVIIGGGDDISPTLYGGELMAEARLDPERDALEQRILREAFDRHMPALGICRGSQMINIVLGGTLDQDAYAHYESRYYRTILPKKCVTVQEGSLLARATCAKTMRVNALHTQAVRELGEGLRVAARDEGGMVQSVERVADPFALGVQWHPEHLFYRRRHRRIFRAIVAAARARRGETAQITQALHEMPAE